MSRIGSNAEHKIVENTNKYVDIPPDCSDHFHPIQRRGECETFRAHAYPEIRTHVLVGPFTINQTQTTDGNSVITKVKATVPREIAYPLNWLGTKEKSVIKSPIIYNNKMGKLVYVKPVARQKPHTNGTPATKRPPSHRQVNKKRGQKGLNRNPQVKPTRATTVVHTESIELVDLT